MHKVSLEDKLRFQTLREQKHGAKAPLLTICYQNFQWL